MKLGEAWSDKQTFRKLKDKGSVLFHVLNLNVKITTTFFDENKKPIRENDARFNERMTEWENLKQAKYEAKQAGNEEMVKELDKKIYARGASVKYFFDIINRQTEAKEVLEMTPGAAKKLNDLFLKEYSANSHDFILENTGGEGVHRYTVLPAPVKKPLTEKELKAIEQPEVVDPVDSLEI